MTENILFSFNEVFIDFLNNNEFINIIQYICIYYNYIHKKIKNNLFEKLNNIKYKLISNKHELYYNYNYNTKIYYIKYFSIIITNILNNNNIHDKNIEFKIIFNNTNIIKYNIDINNILDTLQTLIIEKFINNIYNTIYIENFSKKNIYYNDLYYFNKNNIDYLNIKNNINNINIIHKNINNIKYKYKYKYYNINYKYNLIKIYKNNLYNKYKYMIQNTNIELINLYCKINLYYKNNYVYYIIQKKYKLIHIKNIKLFNNFYNNKTKLLI